MGFLDTPSRGGDVLRASHINEIKEALRSGRVVAGDTSSSTRLPGGTMIRSSRRDPPRAVMTGSSGIPAASSDMLTPGSATARVYAFDGTVWFDTGNDLVVFNSVPTAVAASKLCLLVYYSGFPFVVVEPC